jgi:hypothetical protein
MNKLTRRFCTIVFPFLGTVFLLTSCSDDAVDPTSDLTPDQAKTVEYFKEIALGFEFGGASAVTRKWVSPLKVYVGGQPSTQLLDELDRIIDEINMLATDGFSAEVVTDTLASNYYLFLGSADAYASIFPDLKSLTAENWGLFNVFWDSDENLTGGFMYVDIIRADDTEQKHLLREEFTQSLGLARDSFKYGNSIFQQTWTTTSDYAPIDRELIRLLYHPKMHSGLNANSVDKVLVEILRSENPV